VREWAEPSWRTRVEAAIVSRVVAHSSAHRSLLLIGFRTRHGKSESPFSGTFPPNACCVLEHVSRTQLDLRLPPPASTTGQPPFLTLVITHHACPKTSSATWRHSTQTPTSGSASVIVGKCVVSLPRSLPPVHPIPPPQQQPRLETAQQTAHPTSVQSLYNVPMNWRAMAPVCRKREPNRCVIKVLSLFPDNHADFSATLSLIRRTLAPFHGIWLQSGSWNTPYSHGQASLINLPLKNARYKTLAKYPLPPLSRTLLTCLPPPKVELTPRPVRTLDTGSGKTGIGCHQQGGGPRMNVIRRHVMFHACYFPNWTYGPRIQDAGT